MRAPPLRAVSSEVELGTVRFVTLASLRPHARANPKEKEPTGCLFSQLMLASAVFAGG
jgi:hypothetical protein